MNKELEINHGKPISPEYIRGHDFRVPAIARAGTSDHYQLAGLNLPHDWQTKVPPLIDRDPQEFFLVLEELCQFQSIKGELQLDERTGLITKLTLKETETGTVSSVHLNMLGGGGQYLASEVFRLDTAAIYQKFFALYLDSFDSSLKGPSHAYIDKFNTGSYGSIGLGIPEGAAPLGEMVNEAYLRKFESRANHVAGQFGRTFNYARFSKNGVLQSVQIDSQDCNYSFDDLFRQYFPHNVDNVSEAATLHGIVAAYINDILAAKGRTY